MDITFPRGWPGFQHTLHIQCSLAQSTRDDNTVNCVWEACEYNNKRKNTKADVLGSATGLQNGVEALLNA